ncbi:nitrite reductase large subunit NirB [Lihuaxuella thermophila]|uniref:Nitrite reductase (NADH) large subunit n=1 Tax=Lihuaxuella thermophila TaxID=1173111 RepID=A0A1H8IL77_9BACL|nr:nitrite reductase large subunit NirB [Lihuaxuella thermophila]SEN69650.1 nitrite reductase (NADH) large subunit [Lihuaxuella thermophila]
MQKKKLVLIGNGMAGVRAIEEILKLAPEAFDITIFGSEPHPNYNRILLSKVLQGDTSIDDITIHDWNWYKENHIRLFAGETVVRIDPEQQVVMTDRNRRVEYDACIIATGSLPFMLPLPGADKEGVTAFRNIQDCQRIIETSKNYKKAVVIGGGLLGLEAARGLLNLGMQVDVVHLFPYLMERQLDPTAGKLLQRELEKQGMNFLLKKQTEAIIGRKRVKGLRFKDGSKTEADLVVMAVGIRPNVALAKESGIEVNRGIVVNDYMQTNIPNIYAVGECAEHRGTVYGLVAPLYEQAKELAKKICGIDSNGYQGSILYSQLKVSGVDVFSAGEFMEDEHTRAISFYDEINGVYKKVLIRNNKMVGAILFGDVSESAKWLHMISQQADVSEVVKLSLFPSSPEDSGSSMVAKMPDHEVVCRCNRVTKGAIMKAICNEGLSTVEEVKQCTKASGSCGGCKPLVASILEYTLHEAPDTLPAAKEPICDCTTWSHDEVIQAIKEKQWTHREEAMKALGWIREEGCSVCRPALDYYIRTIHPEKPETAEEFPPHHQQGCGSPFCGSNVKGNQLLSVLETKFARLPTPHRVKIGVSPCQCNAAEAMIKDFGVVGAPGGWELYVGGRGDTQVRAGQLLCTVDTEAEVLEMAGAFLQYYRETAHFLERTSKWIERLGVEQVREVLFDPEARTELLERLEVARSMSSRETGREAREQADQRTDSQPARNVMSISK